MSRKSLGKAGRTITKTVKVTAYEAEHLERKYGSVSAGLRAGLECLLPASVNHPGRAPKPDKVMATQNTLAGTSRSCGPNVEDHPGWNILGRGTKTKTVVKACRVCGERVTEKE
jgi:hypothetical protein